MAMNVDREARKSGSYMRNALVILLSGVLGALAMSAVFAISRVAALTQVGLEEVLGFMATGKEDVKAWWIGFAGFVVIGGLIAFIYAGIFKVSAGSGWRRGMVIGFVQALLFAYAYQTLLFLPPYLPVEVAMPSALGVPEKLGFGSGIWTGVLMLVSHGMYGGIVGGFIHRFKRLKISRTDSTEKEAA